MIKYRVLIQIYKQNGELIAVPYIHENYSLSEVNNSDRQEAMYNILANMLMDLLGDDSVDIPKFVQEQATKPVDKDLIINGILEGEVLIDEDTEEPMLKIRQYGDFSKDLALQAISKAYILQLMLESKQGGAK